MEKLLVEFARHADRERFELRFLPLGERGSLADEIEGLGWPVVALHSSGGSRLGRVWRLSRLLREWQIDVVHTHNVAPFIYAAPAARLAGVDRVIHSRHGPLARSGRAGQTAFRWTSGLAHRIVCVSNHTAQVAEEEGIARRRLCTIWNGIDLSRFAYLGPKAQGPVVTVARLAPEKDIETLVRAVAIARRSEPSLRLEVAGDGECRPALQQLAVELGVGDHVLFRGEDRDIPQLLARSSVFVLPSLAEGISLTLLEAMARGLPVVATRVGGNPEVIVDGESGLLVEVRAAEDLARAILKVYTNADASQQMGLTARRRVEQHFDVRRMVADYEALYVEP
jgi:glycosyltransferase involved in cell wall biosynthesis